MFLLCSAPGGRKESGRPEKADAAAAAPALTKESVKPPSGAAG